MIDEYVKYIYKIYFSDIKRYERYQYLLLDMTAYLIYLSEEIISPTSYMNITLKDIYIIYFKYDGPFPVENLIYLTNKLMENKQ